MRALTKMLIAVPALVASLTPALAGPALLFDALSGKVLYAEDVDDSWYPASLTKIMTAYVAFEAVRSGQLKLDQKVVFSEAASLQPPSKVGLPPGHDMTVEQALQALIVKSANDVAVMLAEAISGSEAAFVERMNATAAKLGMTKSKFVTANGLPAPDQATTARDLAKLARAIIRDYPEYARYWAMSEMHIGKIRLHTHNALLKSFEGADGLKTGFTCDSGYNVVATATRDNRRLVAVVLGEPDGSSRAIRAASLLEHGFQMQGWKQLFNSTTIDNLEPSKEPKSLESIRTSVAAWSCNPRPKRVRTAKKIGDLKAKVAAVKSRVKAAETAAAGTAAPAAAKPQAAPALQAKGN